MLSFPWSIHLPVASHDAAVRQDAVYHITQSELLHLSLYCMCILVGRWQFGDVDLPGEESHVQSPGLGRKDLFLSAIGITSLVL